MDVKSALKAHMSKGKGAHPDSNVKKMKAGGVTSLEAKKYGRNMARVMNQRSKTK
jgi:gluconate kinase